MYFLKHIVKYHALFHIPHGENDRPPLLIRGLLITTCTLVSFFHGSNDGQKGVGLLMLILIAFLPAKFAVNHHIPNNKVLFQLNQTEQVLQKTATLNLGKRLDITTLVNKIDKAKFHLSLKNETDKKNTYLFRKQIEEVIASVKAVRADKTLIINKADDQLLSDNTTELTKVVEFAPLWVVLLISISLGLGTMIGWKRIVVTIGEKIGNEHLNYAQGATSEIVAASTIGLSTAFGLPVSTTHVLSSGIAGAMVASGGKENLNSNTLKNIGLAWVLTLPVSIVLAILLFMLFHLFI
jgi:PiT family inorganic phosphate transporter